MDYPAWYTPSKVRKTANRRVLMGRHPMGLDLGPEDRTCGDCVHICRRYYSGKYIKCELVPPTRGPATDIRLKWRACIKFEEQP